MTDNLKSLAVFIAVLAIAASIVAGVYYLAVDFPAQEAALHPPANSESCTIISSKDCSRVRFTTCYAPGTDPDWLQSCMKDNGCCV